MPGLAGPGIFIFQADQHGKDGGISPTNSTPDIFQNSYFSCVVA
jgi:hypothetical protein